MTSRDELYNALTMAEASEKSALAEFRAALETSTSASELARKAVGFLDAAIAADKLRTDARAKALSDFAAMDGEHM